MRTRNTGTGGGQLTGVRERAHHDETAIGRANDLSAGAMEPIQ